SRSRTASGPISTSRIYSWRWPGISSATAASAKCRQGTPPRQGRAHPVKSTAAARGRGAELADTRSNLATRLLTALVCAPLILFLLYLGPAWGWFVFVAIAAVVGAVEFFAMTHPSDRISQAAGVVLTIATMGVLWWFEKDVRALLALVMLVPMTSLFVVLW